MQGGIVNIEPMKNNKDLSSRIEENGWLTVHNFHGSVISLIYC